MKNQVFLSFFLIMALIFVSCPDSSDSGGGDGPDLYFEIPTEDSVSHHMHDHGSVLYYYSAADIALNHSSLVDNMVKRYKTAKKWDKADDLKQGDMFLFAYNEFAAIQGDSAKFEAFKKMYYDSGVILAMEGGYETDFSRVCATIGCYNPYEGMSDAKHLPGEKPLWVFSGPLPQAAGVVVKLCPSDESTAFLHPDYANLDKAGFLSDYYQGQFCDLAVNGIKKAMKAPSARNAQALTDLISAYKVFSQYSYPINPKLYKKDKEITEPRIDPFQVELDIYNAYSETEQRNYYYIHAEIICSFVNGFIGEYHRAGYKNYGFYGRSVTFSCHPDSPAGVIIHQSSPQTTRQTTTYTSGVSFNLGGEVTLAGPGASVGISISKSQTYSIDDVTISELTSVGASPVASWKFALRDPTVKSALDCWATSAITDCSLTGRTTFHGGTDFIVSMPKGHDPAWWVDCWVVLELREYSAGSLNNHWTLEPHFWHKFNLPKVK